MPPTALGHGKALTGEEAMKQPKRAEPPILALLEKAFAKYRKKVKPLFPYDAKTAVIHLPHHIEEELRRLIVTGNPVEAVKRVTELTGAGLRVAKDYVDSLRNETNGRLLCTTSLSLRDSVSRAH
jgi:hypothetical protein